MRASRLPALTFGPIVVIMAVLAPSSARGQSADAWFGPDKALHFGVSAGLAIGGYSASALFFEAPSARLMTGAGFALTLGVAKELNDLSGNGDPSWRDLTWNLAGTAVGLAVAWLVDVYLLRPERAPSAPGRDTSSLNLWRRQSELGAGWAFSF